MSKRQAAKEALALHHSLVISRISELMAKHGLIRKGWSFHISPKLEFEGSRVLGLCEHKGRRLYFLEEYVLHCSLEELDNLVYHEIAHALDGKIGHNRDWRRIAKGLGSSDEVEKHMTVADWALETKREFLVTALLYSLVGGILIGLAAVLRKP